MTIEGIFFIQLVSDDVQYRSIGFPLSEELNLSVLFVASLIFYTRTDLYMKNFGVETDDEEGDRGDAAAKKI